MKKIFTVLMALLVSAVTIQAQNYRADIYGGIGTDNKTKVRTGANFAVTFNMCEDIEIGGGTGFHYYRPAWRKLNSTYSYANEFSIPLYAEVKYNFASVNYSAPAGNISCSFFVLADLGYNIALNSTVGSEWQNYKPDITPTCSNLFIEPQVGVVFGKNIFLSLGLYLQRCKWTHLLDYLNSDGFIVPHQETERGLSSVLALHLGINF